ncbi:MAG: hypothetical protein KatS3mg076_0227 [Candidatus Binatia bacterium]|nr:MAG: hypothetical protein KatS3mg076_0227 [Candidatus Binatia bacterium]
MELQALAPGIYACIQPDRGFGWNNSGLVARGGGLVVDTFFDLPHTRRLLELYSTVLPGPPKRLVNTHHNGDHCWGNQLFEGAEILAHRRCAEFMGRELSPEVLQALVHSPSPPRAMRTFAEDAREFDFEGIRITKPTRVFEEPLELDLDGVAVRLLPVGPAHTASDVLVYLPDEGIVFAGDVVFRLCTPISWEGTTAGWLAALERIEQLRPSLVVPGHGPVCDLAAVRELGEYFRYVQAEAEACFRAGLPLADACRKIDPGPYAGWTEPERIVFQVARVYRELEGVPWDAPLDVRRLFELMEDLRDFYRGRG